MKHFFVAVNTCNSLRFVSLFQAGKTVVACPQLLIYSAISSIAHFTSFASFAALLARFSAGGEL